MARKKIRQIEFDDPQTMEKMNYIASQHPGKTMQELLEMAVDCLFRTEADKIKRNIERLMSNPA